MNLRLPNITAKDTNSQLAQVKSYLIQLIGDLNFALATVDKEIEKATAATSGTISPAVANNANSPISTFNSIKALIIKSADIVNAYYQEINKKLVGEYVAKSDFGEYQQKTANEITANSTNITQIYSNLQKITSEISTISENSIASQAWIKSGLLEETVTGVSIYGVEVGQRTEVNGAEMFNKYARFTADGISFYLPSSTLPVAWMNGTKLYITNAEITNTLKLGKYILDLSNGVAFKWEGV